MTVGSLKGQLLGVVYTITSGLPLEEDLVVEPGELSAQGVGQLLRRPHQALKQRRDRLMSM